jgi:hypothetical protein
MITTDPAINTQLHMKQTLLAQNDPNTLLNRMKTVTDVQSSDDAQRPTIREAFDDFVGQTFYGQMISAMRTTVGKPAYFHGGRAEEIFQSQMDQKLAEHMSNATAETFSGPMFELFALKRQ